MNLHIKKKLIFFFLLIYSLQSISQQNDSISSINNEPKEDVLTKKNRKFIYFISNRISEDDKFDIFKVIPGYYSPALIVIRGHFEIIDNPNLKKAKISVYNTSNNELVGIYNTNSYTGNYLMILAPNFKYRFVVESTGYGNPHEFVEIPLKIDYEICQQEIKIKLNEKQKPVLLINSFFADENEKVFYLKTLIDTAQVQDVGSIEALTKQVDKNGKLYDNIDALIKQQQQEERKKPEEALAAFNSGNYEKALSIYNLLIQNDPLDPFLNYYYGISIFKTNGNKAKAINALQIATGIKEIPSDVYYYLGKALHLSYLFQDAIKAFEQYRARIKPYDYEKQDGPLYIQNCLSGNMLLNDQVHISVTKRIPITKEEILSSYNPDLINEIIKIKPEFYNSSIDKKKQSQLLMCASNPKEIYHVSYGEKEQNHTDIYKNTLLPNGTMSASQYLGIGPEINSPYDENYPYLSADKNTLYFSSKGHNSMGGYDIFKCTRKDSASAWSKPINLGYPINSTYDDVLYIPNEKNNSASYCTNRKNNNYEYIEVKFPKNEIETSIIKGKFITTDSIQKKDAYITVYNSNTGEIAGVYKTNSNTGLYLMILPTATKYEVSVESDGINGLVGAFEIPEKKGDFELKQTITLQTKQNPKTIVVKNYFTEAEAAKALFENGVTNTVYLNANSKNNISVIKKVKRSPEESLKDEEDLQLALKLFEQATYQEAALIYKNLELYIDLKPMDAYRYGVSLFYTKKDKTDCISALEASEQEKNIPIEIYYYLAKANQVSYRFSTAINYYKKYMAVCKPEDITAWKIEQELQYCKNGIQLVNNPVVLEVYNKKHVDLNVIQNSLTQIESGGKILVITDDMRTELDVKKDFKSLLFLTNDKNTILYSSYGTDENNGKDIYMLKKMENGKWATLPQNLSSINSMLDEEYPALSKDGKTLYFSSKGHNTMGGYDIYKSTWDEKTETWSKPINLGSPINSPYDDIYFLE